MAACLEPGNYHQMLIALVAVLTRHFHCEQVSIGEMKRQHSEIIAFSHNIKFDNKANMLRCLANAMDEAVEQDRIIVHPPIDNSHNFINRAHLELSKKYGAASICTLPLMYQDSIFAAVTLERIEEKPFVKDEVLLLEQTLALLSPYLHFKRASEKGFFEILGYALKKQLGRLFGLNHLGLKIFALSIILLLIAVNLIKDEFKIHANAILEGKIQRVISAPMQGFILTANARAGDTLKKGEVLATMDNADLKLEAFKLNMQLQKTTREYREVMATRDLVKITVLNAQLEQNKAQLQLIKEQLQRTQIVAPFDGVVIEGDLSQALGSPVERGDRLFKMAPLEGYRIILKVNERLISYVRPGQSGMLALSSLPEQSFPLSVEKITAVSKAEDGNNIFRVEASLQSYSDLLRPGMAGVGKINDGQKTLFWIWTHELSDWVKLWLWFWWP